MSTHELTEDDRDVVRWFAERLGWDVYVGAGTLWFGDGTHHGEWWEKTEDGEAVLCTCDLLGWPGFGLAVEEARKAGLEWDAQPRENGTQFRVSMGTTEQRLGRVIHTDPALAAYGAFRDALGGHASGSAP